MHILSPETENCPSWISRRERKTIENISWSISTKQCCQPGGGQTHNLMITSPMRIQMSHRGWPPWKVTYNIQEAHGPWFAHLSDIVTADMQMLSNIFPILSSQLMKISSFEQFTVLKKNIWAWQSMEHDHLNKLSITFQQKDQCDIWWKLAKWFLKNHYDFIHVNSTVAGKYYKYKRPMGHGSLTWVT